MNATLAERCKALRARHWRRLARRNAAMRADHDVLPLLSACHRYLEG